MSSRHKEAVYLVVPSPDFRPTSPWNWPPRFTGGTLFEKNVSMADARAYARIFNKEQMANGRPIERWAVACRFRRPRNYNNGNGNSKK